jgi:hypothetical protein
MALENEPTPDELTRERHLYDLYRVAERDRPSRYTRLAKFGMFAALVAYAVGSIWMPDGSQSAVKMVRDWADAGLGFASQIVGFLLAGFTIFATMNAKEFTLALARKREPKTGESYLKYIYLAFIRVFTIYLVLIALCVAVKVLGSAQGPVSALLGVLPTMAKCVARGAIARTAFVALGSALWFVVVDLFAFVFDIYHTVMAGVRWEYEAQLAREKKSSAGAAQSPTGGQ